MLSEIAAPRAYTTAKPLISKPLKGTLYPLTNGLTSCLLYPLASSLPRGLGQFIRVRIEGLSETLRLNLCSLA